MLAVEIEVTNPCDHEVLVALSASSALTPEERNAEAPGEPVELTMIGPDRTAFIGVVYSAGVGTVVWVDAADLRIVVTYDEAAQADDTYLLTLPQTACDNL